MGAHEVAVHAARGYMQFLAMLHVMLLHNEPLWGGVRGGVGECSGACSPLVAWVSDAIYPVAMPTFLVVAALHERRRSSIKQVHHHRFRAGLATGTDAARPLAHARLPI